MYQYVTGSLPWEWLKSSGFFLAAAVPCAGPSSSPWRLRTHLPVYAKIESKICTNSPHKIPRKARKNKARYDSIYKGEKPDIGHSRRESDQNWPNCIRVIHFYAPGGGGNRLLSIPLWHRMVAWHDEVCKTERSGG